MKKSLKHLRLNKEVISNLDLNILEGGGTCYCDTNLGFTEGAMNTCAGAQGELCL